MRILRVAITALLSLGLVLSPVAAGMARAHGQMRAEDEHAA
jgi:hypothetical protein